MNKLRSGLGLLAAAIVLLSSFAHSILGWRALGGELAKTNTPADLVTGLEIGWRWGGIAMVPFGLILLSTFWPRFSRRPGPPVLPAALISVTYLAAGAWAFVHSNYDPFFFTFIVPGALMAVAVSGREQRN
jgi:hypothetical protein